ncbi:hypothetical protein SAMN05421823_11424 [Catalinimonas alkaloidigena]|uniref:Cupin domain-containing protein n=1 Tax=Catalinimonas alkaloidigena TaxID=1075417 RepID=A0A1G9THV7_9BACT|nr:hypothetical protein [Catalinimonas alkaloidigena]SDM47250.1 hypothetical protein SAMN05421823_11424 [Catalinimonas alkaloidigena]
MTYTRLYSDAAGDTHFEDVDVPLTDRGTVGALSALFPVTSLQFRENRADYAWDFHTAPARQFIVLLDGEIEITTSRGDVRTFGAGQLLLVEDTTGKGHRTRNLTPQPRKSLFIQV